MDDGVFAAVMHMEGCEAIDENLDALETFYAAGLRSLGPVWSRNNIFGYGVPFRSPARPISARA
ncbi:Membrane dipeptidase [compost metagenome]